MVFLQSFVNAAELEYRGYMRTPVGTNSSNGKQLTLNNPGSQGNEFRLGNEVPYAEATFMANFIPQEKGKPKRGEFFNSTITFAFNPPFNTQYGDTNSQGDNIQMIEAFIEGGYTDEVNASLWAGKRFYRESDLHMDDFYYFADMSGAGGGVEDIPMGDGKLEVALLQYSDQYVQQSYVGIPAKQALDIRWKNNGIATTKEYYTVWLAEAYSAPGSGIDKSSGTAVPVTFSAATGGAIGFKWQHQLESGFNEMALIYGNGVMENLTLNADPYSSNTVGGNLNSVSRWRFVESLSSDFGTKYAVQTSIVQEYLNRNTGTNSRWTSIGVRPTYHLSSHFQLTGQVGYSIVNDSSEVTSGGQVGDRTLMRVTFAPEMSIGHGIYDRPVVRAYVSMTSWNGANGDLTNTKSLASSVLSQNNWSIRGQLNQTEVGVEGEVWF